MNKDKTGENRKVPEVDRMNVPVPTEIKLNKDKDVLTVTFEDGVSFEFSAEFLRVTSPSAEVQGHSPEQKRIVPGKKNVKITKIEPVGNYAVMIAFDDGHDTGIFSWHHFYTTGVAKSEIWKAYLQALEEKGLSRE